MTERHLDLYVFGTKDRTDPVAVRALGEDLFEVLRSPGLVEGIAAGDVIRLKDARTGRFSLVQRGGNISVKMASLTEFEALFEEVKSEAERLGGRCDGRTRSAAVFTFPATSPFRAIAALFDAAKARHPRIGWWFGNVHDEDGAPIGGWPEEI